MDEFIGTVKLFAFNFAPRNWALCNGQVLQIAQNTALFSMLGTMYGGNGTTTFALPDLRSRLVVGAGQGTGLSSYAIGQTGGVEGVTLQTANMPSHNHAISVLASSTAKTNSTPAGNILGGAQIYTNAAIDSTLDPGAAKSANVGSGTQFGTLPPFLAMNYCICLIGLFPSRN
jgi:microcystin-dependent protein